MKPGDPGLCDDETPIFRMIARKLGGYVAVRKDYYEMTQYTTEYIMRLTSAIGERNTDLTWDLRGGPSSPNF